MIICLIYHTEHIEGRGWEKGQKGAELREITTQLRGLSNCYIIDLSLVIIKLFESFLGSQKKILELKILS